MITAHECFEHYLLIPQRSAGARRLVPMTLHPAQAALIDAYDATDAGVPRYAELAALWLKKAGKSETCGGLAIAELIGNDREPDREVLIVAGDVEQAQSLTFMSACRFVRRNPWLDERCKVNKLEIIYRETVVDQRTGGQHTEDHILRAAPADPKTNHGGRQCLTVFDEFWVHDAARGYDLLEALALAPTRKHPRLLYATYAGLKSQQAAGYPLWDLWCRWQAGTDPGLFVSYLGGAEGWRSIPWITEKFLDQQRRQFAHVPSKFARLWLNQWAAGDLGTFLTADEIRAATDRDLTEATGPVPGAVIGVDLGLTFDTTGIVASHVDADQQCVVDAVRILRGTPSKPVRLMQVEEEIVTLASVLRTTRVVMDRWQAALLAERLRVRGLNVTLVTSDAASLDKWATRLKRWFAQRLIRIPAHVGLIEQLESLEAEELRRRDRVRFTATGANHDDAPIALVLSAEPHHQQIGQTRIAEMPFGCNLEQNGRSDVNCFLWHGQFLGEDSLCRTCPGKVSAVAQHRRYVARGGDEDLRSWVRNGGIQPNRFLGAKRMRRNFERLGLR